MKAEHEDVGEGALRVGSAKVAEGIASALPPPENPASSTLKGNPKASMGELELDASAGRAGRPQNRGVEVVATDDPVEISKSLPGDSSGHR